MKARVLAFASRLSPAMRSRLRHEVEHSRGAALNDESLQFARLYQNAPTELRQRLYAIIEAHPCCCVGCL